MNIIAADNSPERIEELSRTLREAFPDCTLRLTDDPLMVLKYHIQRHADLIVSEVDLKHGGALRMAWSLHELSPGLLLILYGSSPKLEDEALDTGANSYLIRPLSPEMLLEAVSATGRLTN